MQCMLVVAVLGWVDQKLQLVLLSSTDLLAVVNYSVKEIILHMLIKSQFVFKFFCLELTNLCLYYIARPPP